MLVASILLSVATPPALGAYSVAGVRLGDTPQQARSALAAAGYAIGTVRPTETFAQRLADERDRQLGRRPSSGRPEGIGGVTAMLADQMVEVSFDDDAAGRRVVSEVTYTAAAAAHPYERALTELQARHGAPDRIRPYGAAWCGGDRECDVGSSSVEGKLEVRSESDMRRDITSIRLELGEKDVDANRRAHREALSRLMEAKDAF